jgi:hypothetical protein
MFGKATEWNTNRSNRLGISALLARRVPARYGESCRTASTTTQLLLRFSHNSFTSTGAQFLQLSESSIENQEHARTPKWFRIEITKKREKGDNEFLTLSCFSTL